MLVNDTRPTPSWVIAIAGGVPFLFIIGILFFAKPPRTELPLRSTVTQGNLVIAMEQTTHPKYRLYIYKETHANQYGKGPITEPAQAFFYTNTSPDSTNAATFTYTLTTEEWRTLDWWWTDWCHHQPPELTTSTSQAAYRVALRCGLGLNGTLFTISPDTLPPAVQAIVRRATYGGFS